MPTVRAIAFALAAVSCLPFAAAHAAPFTPGNVVVYRAGDGTTSLVNLGNPVFADEYTPAGTLVQSIALPVAFSAGVNPLVASGTATSEGLLTRSADKRYLVLTGYASTLPAAASLSGTTGVAVPRTVGRIDFTGTVDTSTGLTDFASGNNPRSAVSTDGTNFWVTGGAGGIRHALYGATTSTQLSTTVTNLRQAGIADGQLFVSTSSGAVVRLGTVGTGTPTASGQTIANLPGFPVAGSPYAYYFADLTPGVPGIDTVYVAFDDASALKKYSLVGGTWVDNGSIGIAADAYRGVTGVTSGATVTLFATRKGGSAAAGGGELVSLVDASGYNGAFTGLTPALLATAAANTAFRGVALAPESPERAVNLSVSANSASESAGTVITVTATASGPVVGPQSVALSVAGVNVTPTDYSLSSTTIAIADGMATGSVTFTILNDADAEGVETASLSISAPTAGLVLGATTSQAIAIEDDEARSVSLSASATSATEGAGPAITVTATASGPVAGDQTVNVVISGVNATDYSLSATTITILSGETSGFVTFTVADDAEIEATEFAVIDIASPSAGLVLGAPITRTVSILDNDSVNTAPTIACAVAAISGAISDPTQPGFTCTVGDAETSPGALVVTPSSGNAAVVPDANIGASNAAGTVTVAVNPVGVGYATLTFTVSDGALTAQATVQYAASAAASTPSTTRFHYGTSDGSTGVAIDANFMLGANDEDETIRLYARAASGMPVATFDMRSVLNLPDSREVDIEAAMKVGSRVFWLGSHSNSSGGSLRPSRYRVFATDLAGSGAATTLTFAGRYDHLRADLIAWDGGNGHGLGANYLGLAASAAAGVIPEAADGSGFNIEGLVLAPDDITTYLAFRAPRVPLPGRAKALIVPVTNGAALLDPNGGVAGTALFGAPIELDLGGRGIREIAKNAAHEYVIIAGSSTTTGAAPNDFRLYTWDGNPASAPVLRTTSFAGFNTDGSFEGILEVPTPLTASSALQLLVDNGDTIWYGDGLISKDVPTPAFRKYRSETLALGAVQGATPRIHEIQGARHYSAFHGQAVSNVPGIVTDVRADGFFMQDETGDGDPATSDGIFVYTGAAPAVAAGNRVEVSGEVFEFRPGCTSGANNLSCVGTGTESNSLRLTLTEIGRGGAVPTVAVTAAGPFPLPAPVVMGAAGRAPPTGNVAPACASTGTDVETFGACPFEPNGNALDYFESLEGMRVRVVDPVAVTGFTSFDEFWVLGDNGAGATGRNARGGITISAGDLNPERILMNLEGSGTGANLAGLKVGTRWTGNFDGVLNYSFGDYKVDLPNGFVMPVPDAGSTTLPQEATTLAGTATKLTIASYNVENLAGNSSPSKFNELADQIVNRLNKPDIVAVVEIQDNNGQQAGSCPGDGLVSATTTYANLIGAISSAPGGLTYQYTQIDPQDCTDGGAPTGNIRVGFLYNPARVGFTPSAGGGTLVDTQVVNVAGKARLAHNPGRIDPANPAYASSRKPLAAEFTFNGQEFIVVANHWNSKGGDYPEHGRFQPPVLASEVQRLQIAAVVKNFVQSALTIDPATKLVVLGDLNDFPFSPAVTNFKATTPPLVGLVDSLPPGERYSYVFRGNSQVLDHIVVSPALASGAVYDVVHANAEYRVQVSDHDPEVALLDFAAAPVVAAKPFDFNGDGRSDILWRDGGGQAAMWLIDGTNAIDTALLLGAGSGWEVTHGNGDLNGDGRSDLVWKHADGSVAAWLMDGSATTDAAVIFGPGTGWSVTHVADLGGDGRGDLIWRHTDGAAAAWMMNGTATLASGLLLAPGSPWTIVHTADFNADGRKDLVLRHSDGSTAVWLMDGLNVLAAAVVLGPTADWSVTHVGDFDGDGRGDLAWRNGATGDVAIYLMNGVAIASSAIVYSAGPDWQVTHVGDFGGEGRADILWRHADGRIAIWEMNGLAATSLALIHGGDAGWQVAALRDFNNDNRMDLLWRHADGRVANWLMNGIGATATALLFGGSGGWIPAP